jgi:phenylpyruvate tautomerase PptA (4-oxalocrotonate tautomerase family)
MSRPLRAFAVVIAGWTLMRVAALWHVPLGIALPPAEAKRADKEQLAADMARTHSRVNDFANGSVTVVLNDVEPAAIVRAVKHATPSPTGSSQLAARLSINLEPPRPAPALASLPPSLPMPIRTIEARTNVSPMNRLSGSAWALLRPDSAGAPLGTGGTLGGSQAGARFFYETGARKLALTGRISAPLAMRTGREASVGVALRGRSVGILLERRIALDRDARNAMSITAYGGVSDIALPHGFALDGYAQLGIVGARSRDRFGDGAVRILHPMIRSDAMKLSAGASLSGGFQPGISRVDIGPEVVADLPIATTPVRMSVGWRQRVAGNAAPGSGPSISVGFGF